MILQTTSRPRLHLTFHARRRMEQMGLSRKDVEGVVYDYEQSYQQGNYERGTRVYQRGAYAVVTAERADGALNVKTVLHRTQETYVRPEKRRGA